MNNKQSTTVAAILLLALTSYATTAEAACTQEKRILNLGVNAIWMKQREARCVLAAVGGESGTFEIKVNPFQGFDVDLDAITVDAKDAAGPLTFTVAEVRENQKVLVVLVTWDGNPPQNAEFGYTVTVPDLGVLDPTVTIIRTSPLIAYATALQTYAREYLDEAAYEFIVRELVPLEKQATSE
jgi:hypothetical protein